MLAEIGKAARVHPRTSFDAARGTNTQSQRDRLYAELVEAGTVGLTCFQAAQQIGKAANQVAARMEELRECGLAVRLRATRETTPGYRGHVHVARCFAPEDQNLWFFRKVVSPAARLRLLEQVADAAVLFVQSGDMMSFTQLEAAVAALENP